MNDFTITTTVGALEARGAIPDGIRLAYLIRSEDGRTVASGIVTVGHRDPDAVFECWEQENGLWKGRFRTDVLPAGEKGSLFVVPVERTKDGTEHAYFPG